MEIVANRGGKGHVVLNGHPLEIAVVNGHTYLRAGARLFGETGARAGRLADRWIEVPRGTAAAARLTALTSLDDLLGAALSPHGRLYIDGRPTVQTRPAVRLRDSADGAALLVEANAPHLPIRMEAPSGKSGQIELSAWNAPVDLAPPRNPQTMSGAQAR